MSLGTGIATASDHNYSTRSRHQANTVAVALMLATSAVATFDLYLLAASALH